MTQQIYIGNFAHGAVRNRTAFNIDNDAFPELFNAYVWRGRVKRKRGTNFLGQLQRQIQIGSFGSGTISTDGGGNANLLTGLSSGALEPTATLTPGSISITANATTYTDPAKNGTLSGGTGGSVNYATGAIVLNGQASQAITGTFSYFPGLPVMGLHDFDSPIAPSQFPFLFAFDTKYSYQINQTTQPPFFYSTTFYKSSNVPFTWQGQDFQLFARANYSNAFWATNGRKGFHFVNGTVVMGSGSATIEFNFTSNGNPFTSLVSGDKLFFNEWKTETAQIIGASQTNPVVLTIATPPANPFIAGQQIKISGVGGMTELNQGTFTISAVGVDTVTLTANQPNGEDLEEYSTGGTITLLESETVNGVTGTVIANLGGGNYNVTFATGQTVSGTGIAQLLTNSIPGEDGIRWYDGDPTNGTGLPTGSGLGWVNFAPPLTNLTVSIENQSSGKYYLVGANIIVPFKDRLLFFQPVIQTSLGAAITLKDTVLWSWNGTPYYAAPTPTGFDFDPSAYFVDQAGKGGYLPAGIAQPIITVGTNEDALLVGFGGNGRKTRLIYTGNDLQPFLFYNINNEFPSSCQFSTINLDKGMMDIGVYGISLTDQQSCQRIDIEIPDDVFQIQANNNGFQRVNALRDYENEWVYWSYPLNTSAYKFPTQTFLFNYRDNTWGILYENYTVHGYYRPTFLFTWQTVPYQSWETWMVPWNSGLTSTLIPKTIAGNPQGYVLYIGEEGAGESQSGTILALANNGSGFFRVTSINHCVSNANPFNGIGDYLLFRNAIGTVAGSINGKIGKVIAVIDNNTFDVDIPFAAGTYLGLGNYARLSLPFIQTKQLNPFWDQGRKARLGRQQYLLTRTFNAQITLNIYLSQDAADPWNDPTINAPPNSLVYSQLLYTQPELPPLVTAPNTNQQMPTAIGQESIWHRMNTSLIGDSIQLGFTLSDAQMRNLNYATSEIELHGIQLALSPSSLLA